MHNSSLKFIYGCKGVWLNKKKVNFSTSWIISFSVTSLKKKKEKVKSIIYKRNAIKVAYFIVLGDKRLYF